jgi:hypothetical protein
MQQMVAKSVEPGCGPNPTEQCASQRVDLNGTRFAASIMASGSRAPRKQAEYMTATDRARQTLQKNPCTGAVHT